MNPDRDRGGWSVSTLMNTGMTISAAIPVVFFILLAIVSLTNSTQSVNVGVILLCAVVSLLLVILINYFVQHRIRERISGLVDVCRAYMGGDRAARAPVIGDDEVGHLSRNLNEVLDSQANNTRTPALVGGSGDAAALQAQIEKLLQEVSAVGDGDLRVQAEVTPDTLGVLADSFNYMIEELAKVVGRVQSTAVQVTNATRRILDTSAELAQASEAQVVQISQTTEAVEALAIFIQNVARNAQLSVEVAQEALHSAASGQQAVRQTIEGMMLIRENVQETSKKIKRLGERSNEIGEIVRIIEDIADQTNLLALNAAIQSAMAGEHGRGFAVVADEIRLLSERSTESTKRIATLVKSIQGDTYEAVVAMEDSTQEVVKGSQLADEAGRSLNSIYGAVERQAQMIENIARAANEQTSVSEAVAVAMGRISEITRQTDAGTQEAAVSVSYLAELSEQLRASVSTFRLPERGNEQGNAFSSMPVLNDASGNGLGMFGGMDGGDWGQSLPPLPEPDNADSLVAMGSPMGGSQFGYPGQPEFGMPSGLLPQPQFGGGQQGGFGSQQNFGGQQGGFGGPQNFGGQQNFGGPPSFGGQQDYPEMGGFDSQPGFNGQFGGQQFAPANNNFGNQGSFPPLTGAPNSGVLPPHQQQGQPGNSRRLGNQQSNQGQFSFNQDQTTFQNNG